MMPTVVDGGQPLVDQTRQRIQQDTRGQRGHFSPHPLRQTPAYYHADIILADHDLGRRPSTKTDRTHPRSPGPRMPGRMGEETMIELLEI